MNYKISMEIEINTPIHPDDLEDLFLSLFNATVIVWFKHTNLACIDILETTPQLEELKVRMNQGLSFESYLK
jgi:hypothetical protein